MKNLINTTGYTKGTATEKNKINIIPGNVITMKNVDKSLALVPIVGGKPQYNQKVIANPGDEDIRFDATVEAVLEIPTAQIGTALDLLPYNIVETLGGTNQPNIINEKINLPDIVVQGTRQKASNTLDGINQPIIANEKINLPDIVVQGTRQKVDNTLISSGLHPYNVTNTLRGVNPTISLPNNLTPTELVIQGEQGNNNDINNNDSNNNNNSNNNDNDFQYLSGMNPYVDVDPTTAFLHAGAAFGKGGDELFGKTGKWFVGAGGLGKGLLSGARSFVSGLGLSNRINEEKMNYEKNIRKNAKNQGVYAAKKGGIVNFLQDGGFVKELTGNYVEGQDDNPRGNTLVEKGEIIRFPEGEVSEVLGDRHSSKTKGELLNLPGGTKVISDYLQIGAKNAKKIREKYDIKVNAKNKYATTITNYRKKIGLDDLIAEEESIIKKIAKQEDVEHKATRDLNLQILGDKLRQITAKKEPLEQELTEFTDFVFELQPENDEQVEMQEGGQVEDTENQVMQIIQVYAERTGQPMQQIIDRLDAANDDEKVQIIQEMANTVSQNPEQSNTPEQIINAFAEANGVSSEEIVSELSQMTKEQQGQALMQMVQSLQTVSNPIEQFATMNNVSVEEVENRLRQLPPEQQQQALEEMQNAVQSMQKGGVVKYAQKGIMTADEFENFKENSYNSEPTYDYRDLDKTKERLKYIYDQYGIEYPDGYFDKNLSREELDEGFDRLQKYANENLGNVVQHYMAQRSNTKQDLDFYVDNGWITPDELKELNIKTRGGKAVLGVQEQGLLDDVDEKIYEIVNKRVVENNDTEKLVDYRSRGLNDGKSYYRAPMVVPVKFDSEEARDEYIKKNGISQVQGGDGEDIYFSTKQGLYFKPIVKKTDQPDNPTPDNDEEPSKNNEGALNPFNDNTADNSQSLLPALLPDQSALPPSLMLPTMRALRYAQSDPIAVSPMGAIEDITSEASVARRELGRSNPYTAAASKAGLNTQVFKSIIDAHATANRQNAADQRQVDATNEQRQMSTDATNLKFLDTYENNYIAGTENFVSEFRDYNDRKNKERISKFNTQEQINAYNALNPNYKRDPLGGIQVRKTSNFYAGPQWVQDENGKYMVVEDGKVKSSQKYDKPIELPSLATPPIVALKRRGGIVMKESLRDFLRNFKLK